MFQAK